MRTLITTSAAVLALVLVGAGAFSVGKARERAVWQVKATEATATIERMQAKLDELEPQLRKVSGATDRLAEISRGQAAVSDDLSNQLKLAQIDLKVAQANTKFATPKIEEAVTVLLAELHRVDEEILRRSPDVGTYQLKPVVNDVLNVIPESDPSTNSPGPELEKAGLRFMGDMRQVWYPLVLERQKREAGK